jgi:hypothetical protein
VIQQGENRFDYCVEDKAKVLEMEAIFEKSKGILICT